MAKSTKPKVTFKVLAHEVALILPYHFTQTDDDLNGQASWDEKEIRVSNRTNNGTKRSINSILDTIFHELGHIWSQASGHEIFESEDEELDRQKDHELNAFAELMVQTLLESGMLSQEWLDKVMDLADD